MTSLFQHSSGDHLDLLLQFPRHQQHYNLKAEEQLLFVFCFFHQLFKTKELKNDTGFNAFYYNI